MVKHDGQSLPALPQIDFTRRSQLLRAIVAQEAELTKWRHLSANGVVEILERLVVFAKSKKNVASGVDNIGIVGHQAE